MEIIKNTILIKYPMIFKKKMKDTISYFEWNILSELVVQANHITDTFNGWNTAFIEVQKHMNNGDMHVTLLDKAKWNGMLPRDGTLPMQGNLDMAHRSIKNVLDLFVTTIQLPEGMGSVPIFIANDIDLIYNNIKNVLDLSVATISLNDGYGDISISIKDDIDLSYKKIKTVGQLETLSIDGLQGTSDEILVKRGLYMYLNKISGLANGTDPADAVNKSQLDTKLDLLGGEMSGTIDMKGNNITNVYDLIAYNILWAQGGRIGNLYGDDFTIQLPNGKEIVYDGDFIHVDGAKIKNLGLGTEPTDVANLQNIRNALLGFVYNPVYDSANHILTLPRKDTSPLVIDFDLERLIMGVTLDGNDLVFTFEDGSTTRVPLNALLVGVAKFVNDKGADSNGNVYLTVADIPTLSATLTSLQEQMDERYDKTEVDTIETGIINYVNQGDSALDASKINKTDIVNDLETGGATRVLSAEQGKILKSQVDGLYTKAEVLSLLSILDERIDRLEGALNWSVNLLELIDSLCWADTCTGALETDLIDALCWTGTCENASSSNLVFSLQWT